MIPKELQDALDFIGGSCAGFTEFPYRAMWRDIRNTPHYIYDVTHPMYRENSLHYDSIVALGNRWVGGVPCVGYESKMSLVEILVAQCK